MRLNDSTANLLLRHTNGGKKGCMSHLANVSTFKSQPHILIRDMMKSVYAVLAAAAVGGVNGDVGCTSELKGYPSSLLWGRQ